MTGNKLPVTAIVNAEAFLVSLADTYHDVTAPNSAGGAKVTWMETLQFIPLAMQIPAAISTLGDIPAELSDDITTDELAQIEAPILASKYLADKANIQTVTAAGLELANHIKDFIETYFVKK